MHLVKRINIEHLSTCSTSGLILAIQRVFVSSNVVNLSFKKIVREISYLVELLFDGTRS